MSAQVATTPVIVLVHSSSVGPSTWAAVAGELRSHGADVRVPSMLGFAEDGPPYARAYVNRAAAALASLPIDRSVLLVAHSNAGLFLPALAEALEPREVALLFADAAVPDPDEPDVRLAPEAFLAHLGGLATDGVLPPWSEWWPDEDLTSLYPDSATRALVSAEEPRLPLAFYQESLEVPRGWTSRRCAYLLFSAGYESEAARAAGIGWPVRHLAGEHLHMLVDPAGIAGAVRDLAHILIPTATRQEA